MFVYLITNTINGKRYVGQTKKPLDVRRRQHCRSANCRRLHQAILKHGKDNFVISLICEAPTEELMNEFEQEYIVRYCTMVPNGYNLTAGGRVPKHNNETRKKMSLSHAGMRGPSSYSENWTESMRESTRNRCKASGNPNSKLDWDGVRLLRKLYSSGMFSQQSLSVRFGIDQTQVSRIVLGKQWIDNVPICQ